MRKAFVVSSGVLLAAFALQFVFAAVGAFTKPAGGDHSYRLHSITGTAVIPLLTLLTILFAALAKAPGKLIGLTAVPLALVVLQALLAGIATGLTDASGQTTTAGLIVGGLHAVNGIVAVHVVVAVMRGARKLPDRAPVLVEQA
ncbi:DUF6220 domain-containing protein [Actinoplanes subtropicus]|uniref:DUF6220 domain-containing protein n=1 Tax=Actinoplanes subtropicus TaxID=543632 RepID=UPI000557ED0E|nr:DUF6220 domain-containing protein [Actinoplanes subtropicus]